MKKLLLTLALGMLYTAAQAQEGFGLGVTFTTNNGIGVDAQYLKNENRYYIGFTQQQNGQHGARRNAGTSNYGRTSQGGSFFYSLIDLGYGREITDNISVSAEYSFGSNVNYTNYSDLRFTTGGYYDVNYKEGLSGFGGNVAYKWEFMEFFAGYHTVKNVTIGIRLIFK